MNVGFSWVTYCDQQPSLGRWDQAHLARVLAGDDWVVPGVTYTEVPWPPRPGGGQIVIMPTGHYAEHGCTRRIIPKLTHDLGLLDWVVLILTSDEQASFPVERIAHPNMRLWVMLPDPERKYPGGTHFIGEGSPWGADRVAKYAQPDFYKTRDVFFAGQINHPRRAQMADAMTVLPSEGVGGKVSLIRTPGFTEGIDRYRFYERMAETKIAPCPSGIVSQSSFRAFEALEAQAIPIVDAVTADGKDNGYWEFVYGHDHPLRTIRDWDQLGGVVSDIVDGEPGHYEREQSIVSSWWQQYKRFYAWRLHDDISSVRVYPTPEPDYSAGDPPDITVFVATSPSPLHPGTAMIEETLASIRDRLPSSEIFVMADGVRPEQQHRAGDYWEYVRRLCAITNVMPNVMTIVHEEHQHQANMTWDALERTRTPFCMFVEHDTPLEGDIPFPEILNTMIAHDLNLMRFHHETHVLDVHAHLYLEQTPTPPDLPGEVPYVRTMQWSQRPHVALTNFYRDSVISRYFSPDSRTMIEDVMHGVVDHAWRTRAYAGWEQWRLAVYAPEGSMKRSGHTDGRRGEPKYPMTFAYPGEAPEGAPHAGTR